MNKLRCINFILFLLWNTLGWATETTSVDEQAIDYLSAFDFSELQTVDVALDDVFDVFDGLVKKRQTKVASGVKQSLERAPSVTSLITAQDIEAMGARTLDEVLRSVPGIQMSMSSALAVMNYTVRGIRDNSALLILLDGVRLNSSRTGTKETVWLTSFPVSAIARIEIIRGPGSALYGADAFTGVINIITKTAKDIDGTEVGIRLGSNDTQDTWVLHGSQWRDFEVGLMLDFGHTDGHQRTIKSDAQTVLDSTFGTHASLAPGSYDGSATAYNARLSIAKQHWRLNAGVHKEDDLGSGAGVAQAVDPNKPGHSEVIEGDITYHNPAFTSNWGVKAQLNYWQSHTEQKWLLYPPGAFGGAYPIGMRGHPGSRETQSHFKLSATYRGWRQHLLRIGVNYAYYDMYETTEKRNFGLNPDTNTPLSPLVLYDISDTPAVYVPEVARDSRSAFIQDTWTLNSAWELTAGVRYDRYSDFGSTTNPRLGLVWEARDNLTVKLLYGQAFHAPPFESLYVHNNPIRLGNPNLKPEKIRTWELAFDYRVNNNMHLALNLFRYDIDDKITSIPTGPSESSLANATTWSGQGGEFELRWKTSTKSSLLFNYSYQHSKDAAGEALPYASKHTVYARADYLLGAHWYLDTQLNWMSDWFREPHDPRPDMNGYTTVDLTLRRKDIYGGNTNFAISVRNLFNADVRYPSPSPAIGSNAINLPNDLPGADRSYFVEFRYKF